MKNLGIPITSAQIRTLWKEFEPDSEGEVSIKVSNLTRI